MEATQDQYGIIRAKLLLPTRDLLRVPHRQGIDLTVSSPAFGPNTYSGNLAEMQKTYFHSNEFPNITFKEPTTSESVSVCGYDFKNLARPQILDTRWLQLGRIARASEGIFINSPKDKQGNPITDEKILKSFLTEDRKVNGIYLLGNDSVKDFAYVPYESFTRGVQDSNTFVQGGLARGLEYTTEIEAPKLKVISSKKNYPRGVDVFGFDEVKELVSRVAGLGSGRSIEGGRLVVDGDWIGDSCGSAFGVL